MHRGREARDKLTAQVLILPRNQQQVLMIFALLLAGLKVAFHENFQLNWRTEY